CGAGCIASRAFLSLLDQPNYRFLMIILMHYAWRQGIRLHGRRVATGDGGSVVAVLFEWISLARRTCDRIGSSYVVLEAIRSVSSCPRGGRNRMGNILSGCSAGARARRPGAARRLASRAR